MNLFCIFCPLSATWDGPLESSVGVIWLGEAAARVTKNRLKPGIHRVVYPKIAGIRLTMWYEVCTTTQLKSLSEEKQNEVMAGGNVVFDNLPESRAFLAQPGESKIRFLRRVEIASGLTISKAGLPRYELEQHNISYPPNPIHDSLNE
ncbi:unnamed protein product [Adineta ricciae]|uniref:Uncharacterized protein n=1 Tax=Adineta ricciae TaxID=249248 RepID=A0A815VM94_ADIRI|nr:unnamed protein product [Adineta ricciae]CAF1561459.1 unnamed protein product [Adineta ricciae]